MKIAHIEWGKKPRTLGKVKKIRDLEGVGPFHPFKNTRYVSTTCITLLPLHLLNISFNNSLRHSPCLLLSPLSQTYEAKW